MGGRERRNWTGNLAGEIEEPRVFQWLWSLILCSEQLQSSFCKTCIHFVQNVHNLKCRRCIKWFLRCSDELTFFEYNAHAGVVIIAAFSDDQKYTQKCRLHVDNVTVTLTIEGSPFHTSETHYRSCLKWHFLWQKINALKINRDKTVTGTPPS